MTVSDKLDSMLWVEFAILGFARERMKDSLFAKWVAKIKSLKNPEDVNALSELSLQMVENYDIDLSDKKEVVLLLEASEKSLYHDYLVEAAQRVKKFDKAEVVGAFIASILEAIAPGAKVTTKVFKTNLEEEKPVKEDSDFGPLDLDFSPKQHPIVENYIANGFEKYYTPTSSPAKVTLSKDGSYLEVDDCIFKTSTINTVHIMRTYAEENEDLHAVVIIGEYSTYEPFKGTYVECQKVISDIKKSLKF
jgi:hypothetical protein